jgi:hypothetical protein
MFISRYKLKTIGFFQLVYCTSRVFALYITITEVDFCCNFETLSIMFHVIDFDFVSDAVHELTLIVTKVGGLTDFLHFFVSCGHCTKSFLDALFDRLWGE